MNRRYPLALAAAALCACAAVAFAATHYSGGPLPGKTGAPALPGHPEEPNCTECHITFDGNGQPVDNLDVAGGHVSVLDVPAYYVPGRTYTLRVQVGCDSTASAINPRWGFQLTALDAATGATAGTFTVRDPDTVQVVHFSSGPFADRWYVEHSLNGTFDGDHGPVEWSFDWTAPAAPTGTVTFHVAANAADGSEEPSGDWVFTASASILDTTTSVRRTSWGALKSRAR